MHIHTLAVHAGDRRKAPSAIPVTSPIYTAASFFYDDIATLDRVFEGAEPGYCYSRYDNPTNHALEELVAELEQGAGALAASSGMAALQIAIQAALTDRRRAIVAATALYGATVKLLHTVFEPVGVDLRWVDACDPASVEQALAEHRPGCLLVETISNPLLRVPDLPRLAQLARAHGAALVVDNTFATPLLFRPLAHGAHLVVHSVTKFLAGHGDVLGGVVVSDAGHLELLRTLAKIVGPNLGPFESYLTMRGIKTFPLRVERQCANAAHVAAALARHPAVGKLHYPGDPSHPDAAVIARLLPPGLAGSMVSFELKHAATREDVFAFLNRLKLVVRATSLGDVHTLVLYPAMSSHRDLPPAQRRRLGITDSLVRLSLGIEHPADILADLEQALA